MASLFRPSFTDKKTGKQRKTRKWYAKNIPGQPRPVPLSANKAAAQQMLGELMRKAELAKVGIVDAFETHRKRTVAEHLEDYRRELSARGNSPRYVAQVVSRLTALVTGCGFRTTADLSASESLDWLARLRDNERPQIELPPDQQEFTPREAAAFLQLKQSAVRSAVRRYRLQGKGHGRARLLPRATLEAVRDRLRDGLCTRTTNDYSSSLRSFGRWLVKDRRIGSNPFEHLESGNARVDRRHDRRELEIDELRRLLQVTKDSPVGFDGLTGWDRYHLYAVACGTGFRASALASLTPESFDLNPEVPVVTLAARAAKNRRTKVQPIPADVADLLRDYLAGKPAGMPLWGGKWAEYRRGAEMLRIDLEAAQIPYFVPGPDGPLYCDFHALRHTYLTLGGRAGIDLRTLQELAGHSTPTLTARYSHRRLHDLTGAVEKLPNILPGAAPAVPNRSTGTDSGSGSACTVLAPALDSARLGVMTNDVVGAASSAKGARSNPYAGNDFDAARGVVRMPDGGREKYPEQDLNPQRRVRSADESDSCARQDNDLRNGQESLALRLAPEPESCPDLARLIDRWPELPEHVRRTILGIIDATEK